MRLRDPQQALGKRQRDARDLIRHFILPQLNNYLLVCPTSMPQDLSTCLPTLSLAWKTEQALRAGSSLPVGKGNQEWLSLG